MGIIFQSLEDCDFMSIAQQNHVWKSFFRIHGVEKACLIQNTQTHPPLSDEEIRDIKEFYSYPDEHKTGTLQELFDELHSD